MRTSSFRYDLPDELIARYPSKNRSDSRLLVLPKNGPLQHSRFTAVLDILHPGDLVVFNNTKVISARLFGRKETGGAVEMMIERMLDHQRVLAQVRASKSPKPGTDLYLEDDTKIRVVARRDNFFELASETPWAEVLQHQGHIPLPGYMDRGAEDVDSERYQTVYASQPGAVAAPTAGLHFDQALIDALDQKGVQRGEVTLHVGAGTYQPVRADKIEDHVMHAEWISVSSELCHRIQQTKSSGGRVIAVGTTAMRSLETAALNASDRQCTAYEGDTDIFIYPGYRFNCVDALITNFHLSESSLLMLVSAFAGFKPIQEAYAEAIKEKYRFFSYGDAMFIDHNPDAATELPA